MLINDIREFKMTEEEQAEREQELIREMEADEEARKEALREINAS